MFFFVQDFYPALLNKTRLTHLPMYLSLDTLISIIVTIMLLGAVMLVLVVAEIVVTIMTVNLSVAIRSKYNIFHNTQKCIRCFILLLF